MEHKSPLVRTLLREKKIHILDGAQKTFDSFSITEKVLFLGFGALLIGAALSLAAKASSEYSVTVPHRGGKLVEGIVGTPRFINPLLAVSDADRDLTALVYSGLLKVTPTGSFIPDLAQSYNISPDGLIYTFIIREDAIFHDGTPVTADDVEFTITKAQDTALKSPRRVSWEGVTVEKPDPKTVIFKLKQPYAPFISNLTLGILPKQQWQKLTIDEIPFSSLNTEAIGSGPYKIASVDRSSDSNPVEVTLESNPDYTLGEPYIETLDLKFYSNEKALVTALHDGKVESASNLTPSSGKGLEGSIRVLYAPLTRVFGVFFNQNQNELLARKEVRKALSLAVDKDSIINDVLLGFGTKADGPLPPVAAKALIASSETASTSTAGLETAEKTLVAAKWEKNPDTGVYEFNGKNESSILSLSLATANIPELVESARRIEENWKELGAQVDVRVFEPTDLNQGVIRPRKYDALLFGIVTGKNSDLYPFWHSSQRNDPGLNVALYTNAKADKILEKMRVSTSTSVIATQYELLKKEIDTDIPAIFLWSPDFIYAVPEKLNGVALGEITTPSDRFIGIEKWYVETDHVWKIFVKDEDEVITPNI